MRKTIEVHPDVIDRLVIEAIMEQIGYVKDFISNLKAKKLAEGWLAPHEQEDLDDNKKQLKHLKAVAKYFGADVYG